MSRAKRTKKEWNSLPLYMLRTICIVDNVQLVVEKGEIVDVVRKFPKWINYHFGTATGRSN